ncbi:hypothetical protein C8R47DRAFT_111453 [Mycena vitilis]|nr:hypothetical protein C8R47DRAFT_111453 [Mycena vitilis]
MTYACIGVGWCVGLLSPASGGRAHGWAKRVGDGSGGEKRPLSAEQTIGNSGNKVHRQSYPNLECLLHRCIFAPHFKRLGWRPNLYRSRQSCVDAATPHASQAVE